MNFDRIDALEDLPTPALLLDLDALEVNIRAMQDRADRLGVRLRPHLKTHKCLDVARLQRSAGAAAFTVSTLEEARAFSAAGFTDLLWAFPVSPSRIPEVVELARDIELGIAVDSATAVDALAREGAPLSVWLEVDSGYGRTGVPARADELLSLAERLDAHPALRLRGCFTHAGHTYHAADADEILAIAEEERRAMVEVGERIHARGIDPGTLSVGSTPGMSLVEDLSGIDEARPGNYAVYDYTQLRLGACELDRCAVSVLSTVVSAPVGRNDCVADCGALTLSKDVGLDEPSHFGRLYADLEGRSLSESRVTSVSQEHGRISAPRSVGEKLRILPNHACLTVAQFDHFTVVRGADVVDRWKIQRSRGPETRL
ncbi:MAG: alanine racemase [Gemmatimonadetes bacterium]|nr:alanine racemase [Gemmatimonadota bacterium]